MTLVFGTICLDRIKRVPSLPEPGGYVEVLSEHDLLGGEAANTAFALRAWNREVLLVGNPAGDDHAGEIVNDKLAESQINSAPLKAEGSMITPYCDIFVTPNGERTMFGRGFSDAGHQIVIENLPYEAGNWFTADPNFGDAARQAAVQAKEAGMKLYLMDFNDADEPLGTGDVWQSSTDWVGTKGDIKMNLKLVQEKAALIGVTAILTDGPEGLYYCESGGRPTFIEGFAAPQTIDFTGAGDRFRAGMLNGFEQGWSLRDCLLFGAAAGCLKCGSLGGTSYVHSEIEVLRFLKDNGA